MNADPLIETYDFQGYEINIHQNLETVNIANPTFYSVIFSPRSLARGRSDSLALQSDFSTVQDAKSQAEAQAAKCEERYQAKLREKVWTVSPDLTEHDANILLRAIHFFIDLHPQGVPEFPDFIRDL